MEETNAFDGSFAAPQAGAEGARPAETGTEREQDTTPPDRTDFLADDGAGFDSEFDSDFGGEFGPDSKNEQVEGGGGEPSDGTAVTIKFNHKSETISREEAAVRIQKYMQMDPVITKLKYMAAANDQSLTQFMEALYDQNERSLIYKMADKFGNDSELVGEAMKVLRQKNDNAFREMLEAEGRAEQESSKSEMDKLNGRLAGDFLELKAEFPELSDFSKIPKEVVQSAVEKGISLFDSYLRFKHSEHRKSEDAVSTRQSAAKSTTGSQRSADSGGDNPEISAMLRGIWG